MTTTCSEGFDPTLTNDSKTRVFVVKQYRYFVDIVVVLVWHEFDIELHVRMVSPMLFCRVKMGRNRIFVNRHLVPFVSTTWFA